ncbi:MAG: hypothetical protein QNL28_03490 [Flavobacteriaceae bacterium]|jgi:UPF0716 family protein affecting phage T7 exclusion|tara:strand:+ start:191 stop:394 length:204 start_codon:yes stop_codon:yes gene_type:complete
MIRILKYTEYLYLIVAIMSLFKIVSIWGQSDENMGLFIIFALISVGMFLFRRNYRLKFEKRQQENKK